MRHYILRFILVVILAVSVLDIYAYPQHLDYYKWAHIPSKVLYNKSLSSPSNKEMVDSAFIYATLVCSRYSKKLDTEEKIICAKAYSRLLYLYYSFYNDFSKAYDCILKADEIRQEINIDMPDLDVNIGCFYNLLWDLNHDEVAMKQAVKYYKKAFMASCKLKQRGVFNNSFLNLLQLNIDDFKEMQQLYKFYSKATEEMKDPLYKFNKSSYKALLLSHQGKYNEALKVIDSITIPCINVNLEGRLKFLFFVFKAHIYDESSDVVNAMKQMSMAETVALQYNINENRLYAYKNLAKYYKFLGNDYDYLKYSNNFFSLKDSLFGFGQIAYISSLKFKHKMDNMNDEIRDIKQKKEKQSMFFVLFLIIFVIVLVASLLMYFKNKELNKKNKTLYQNYTELCKVESLNNRYRTEKENLKEKLKIECKSIDNDEEIENKHKYSTSALQDEEKLVILDKILSIMENVEEISSSDFSAYRLAELTGIKYNYVSQVINEKYGCSFNALLNKYRVKEVCRRFADVENYGMYTTEAISKSVGFKTRPTFINSFKKETGMTPYQYLKILKSEEGK